MLWEQPRNREANINCSIYFCWVGILHFSGFHSFILPFCSRSAKNRRFFYDSNLILRRCFWCVDNINSFTTSDLAPWQWTCYWREVPVLFPHSTNIWVHEHVCSHWSALFYSFRAQLKIINQIIRYVKDHRILCYNHGFVRKDVW